jgi:RNase P/RNase MRP subunit p29
MKRLALALCLAALALPAAAAAPKTYQVTGPVLDVTADTIVVQKGDEKWEIARTADTKVTGDLKKGEKVTIEYRMTATKVEVKAAKK